MGNLATSDKKVEPPQKIRRPSPDPFPFYCSSDISDVKKHLNLDQEKLKEAFARLEKVLDAELPKLSAEVIPVVNFSDITENNNKFDNATVEKIRKHGIVIIKNVIEKDEAQKLHDDLVEYMTKNGQDPQAEGHKWISTII